MLNKSNAPAYNNVSYWLLYNYVVIIDYNWVPQFAVTTRVQLVAIQLLWQYIIQL